MITNGKQIYVNEATKIYYWIYDVNKVEGKRNVELFYAIEFNLLSAKNRL
jgi:hypothetical protein